MSTDTRPVLTARWRELERKGWVFSLGAVGTIYGDRLLRGRQEGHNVLVVRTRPPEDEDGEVKILETFEHCDAL